MTGFAAIRPNASHLLQASLQHAREELREARTISGYYRDCLQTVLTYDLPAELRRAVETVLAHDADERAARAATPDTESEAL